MILTYNLSNDYKDGGFSMIDILLVDDEPRMLELLTLYLTPMDITAYVHDPEKKRFHI